VENYFYYVDFMGNLCCCQAAREPRARLRENLPHAHLRRQGRAYI